MISEFRWVRIKRKSGSILLDNQQALKLWNQIQKYEGNDLEALKKEAQESMDYCIDLL